MTSNNTPGKGLTRTPLQPKSMNKNVQFDKNANLINKNNDSKIKSVTPVKFPDFVEKEAQKINVTNFNNPNSFNSFNNIQMSPNVIPNNYIDQLSEEELIINYNKNKNCSEKNHNSNHSDIKICEFNNMESTCYKSDDSNKFNQIDKDEDEDFQTVKKAMNFFENENLTYLVYSDLQLKDKFYQHNQEKLYMPEIKEDGYDF